MDKENVCGPKKKNCYFILSIKIEDLGIGIHYNMMGVEDIVNIYIDRYYFIA